jgi:hypothetical protein
MNDQTINIIHVVLTTILAITPLALAAYLSQKGKREPQTQSPSSQGVVSAANIEDPGDDDRNQTLH